MKRSIVGEKKRLSNKAGSIYREKLQNRKDDKNYNGRSSISIISIKNLSDTTYHYPVANDTEHSWQTSDYNMKISKNFIQNTVQFSINPSEDRTKKKLLEESEKKSSSAPNKNKPNLAM